MPNYHFDKRFIAPHTLVEKLKGLAELLDIRDRAHREAWIDTVASSDEATAFDDLTEAHKAEIKRDKWNRDLTKGEHHGLDDQT